MRALVERSQDALRQHGLDEEVLVLRTDPLRDPFASVRLGCGNRGSGRHQGRCGREAGLDDQRLGDSFVCCAIDPEGAAAVVAADGAALAFRDLRLRPILRAADRRSRSDWTRWVPGRRCLDRGRSSRGWARCSAGAVPRSGRSTSVRVATARSTAAWVEPHRGQVSPPLTSRCQTIGRVTAAVVAGGGSHDGPHPHVVVVGMAAPPRLDVGASEPVTSSTSCGGGGSGGGPRV